MQKIAKTSKVFLRLPDDLMERMRNAVFWTPGMTIQRFIESGVRAQLAKAERKNGGKQFRSRSGPLRRGRPPVK